MGRESFLFKFEVHFLKNERTMKKTKIGVVKSSDQNTHQKILLKNAIIVNK